MEDYNKLNELIQKHGYSIAGFSNFSKKALLIYYSEVISFEEVDKLSPEGKLKAQRDYSNWLYKNLDRIDNELTLN